MTVSGNNFILLSYNSYISINLILMNYSFNYSYNYKPPKTWFFFLKKQTYKFYSEYSLNCKTDLSFRMCYHSRSLTISRILVYCLSFVVTWRFSELFQSENNCNYYCQLHQYVALAVLLYIITNMTICNWIYLLKSFALIYFIIFQNSVALAVIYYISR